MSNGVFEALRPEARAVPASGIVDVMNYGRRFPDLIPLWAGEGDLPTPSFIAESATRSLAAGETFYTWQRGLPELRAALAAWHERLYGRGFSPEEFFVTGSGMQAIQIALQCVAGAGEEVIVPTPAWPNFAAASIVLGARPVEVPMRLEPEGWRLDLSDIEAAIGPKTRAIFLNSPANPSGWVAGHDFLAAILELARARGLWIVADEIYARFCWEGALGEGSARRAPSFLDVAAEDDRILYVNTFSKNWAMTGWRIGWLKAPPELGQVIENLIQYATSGVAAFMQRAAITALEDGEGFVRYQIERARRGREIVDRALGGSNRVRFSPPAGAFYTLFAVEGEEDSMALALRLCEEARIGLAPGTAFGKGAEAYLRLCFARGEESLQEAMDRLVAWLAR